jgi:hypothetical protein
MLFKRHRVSFKNLVTFLSFKMTPAPQLHWVLDNPPAVNIILSRNDETFLAGLMRVLIMYTWGFGRAVPDACSRRAESTDELQAMHF